MKEKFKIFKAKTVDNLIDFAFAIVLSFIYWCVNTPDRNISYFFNSFMSFRMILFIIILVLSSYFGETRNKSFHEWLVCICFVMGIYTITIAFLNLFDFTNFIRVKVTCDLTVLIYVVCQTWFAMFIEFKKD